MSFIYCLWIHHWSRLFLQQMLTDLFFLTGTNSAVRFHSKRRATVYNYLFDYHGSNSFISLITNSTDDIGECLQFVEHATYLQRSIRECNVFVSFQNTKLRICTPAHANTHTQNRRNVTMLILMCTWYQRRLGSLIQKMAMHWMTTAQSAERRSDMFITRTAVATNKHKKLFPHFNIICLSKRRFPKVVSFLQIFTPNNVQIYLQYIAHAPTQHISSTFISSSPQYFASTTNHKYPQMMQLSTFSSYFIISLISKYFIGTS